MFPRTFSAIFARSTHLFLTMVAVSTLNAQPTNVLVNDPSLDPGTADTQVAASVLLGSGGSVISVYTDTGTLRPLPGITTYAGWSRSSDGGATFVDKGHFPVTTPAAGAYPVMARNNSNGHIYVAMLTTGGGVMVHRSTDDAQTFSATPAVLDTDSCDVPVIVVDNVPGPGNGNVYVAWRAGAAPSGVWFSKSVDGGLTFSPKASIAPGLTGPALAVGLDHTIHAAYVGAGIIRVAKSTDGGAAFSVPVPVADTLVPTNNMPLGFNAFTYPKLAVNPVSGHLYIAYPGKGQGADRGDIFFLQSTNGTIWTTPKRVNSDNTLSDQFQPVLAVTPDGSRLFVGSYDRRRDPSNVLTDTFARLADISGSNVTFTSDLRVSTGDFRIITGQDNTISANYFSAFDNATADNQFFYYAWADTRLPSAAHANQADIRMAKIPVEGYDYYDAVITTATLVDGDGDGGISPAECHTIQIGIDNIGVNELTNLSATIQASSPHLQVVASPPPVSVLSGGGSLFPLAFRLVSLPSYPCFVDQSLTVTLTTDQTVITRTIHLPAAETGGTSFTNNTPMPIPDNGPTSSTSNITVSDYSGTVMRAKVKLHLTHTFVGDLNIQLESPDGTLIDLFNRTGSGGDNFGNSCDFENGLTVFTDSAPVAIAAGAAPYLGSFRPHQPLAAFVGKSGLQVNGTWKLHVRDRANIDIGTLLCWSLELFSSCTESSGSCDPVAVIGKNSLEIEDGDAEPSPADGTDLGTITGGATISQTFTIQNLSYADSLTLNGTPPITITGPGAAAFSVVGPTLTSIPISGTATFQVQFTPVGGTVHDAVISIPHANGSSSPFTFSVRGTRCLMALSQNVFDFDPAPHSETVTITTNCSWSPVASHPWINITGYDSGSLSFSIPQNNEAARTGTITLAGQVIVINQESPWVKSGIDSGPEWFFDPESIDDVDITTGTPGLMGIIVRPSTGRLRILGWQNPAVMGYDDIGPGKFVRGSFAIHTSNDSLAPVNQVPNFRVRLQNEGAVVANTNFSHSQTGNGGTPHEPLYSLFNDPDGEAITGNALRPSGSEENPSIYTVHFDPVDVPAAAGTEIWAAFESFSTANPAEATLSLSELHASTYPALAPSSDKLVAEYDRTLGVLSTEAVGGAKSLSTGGFNYSNDFQAGRRQELFFIGDGKGTTPADVSTITQGPQGILLDTLNTPADKFAAGIIQLVSVDNSDRPRIQPHMMYLARFYATSNMPTTSGDPTDTIQGSVNFSVTTGRGAVSSILAITGAQNAEAPFNNTKQIAVQALPGVGSANPDTSATLNTPLEVGGWYNVILDSPLNPEGIRADTENFGALAAQPGPGSSAESARDIILGALVLESAATLKLSPTFTAPNAQPNRGKIRISRIELLAYPIL